MWFLRFVVASSVLLTVCAQGFDPADCAAVTCFAACSPGTCSNLDPGECCENANECSPGGCCGDPCSTSSDCKRGFCENCVLKDGNRVCGQIEPDPPEVDCTLVLCFAACEPGTCAPRKPGECCDDLSKCSAGGCCGDPCYSDASCKAGPCGKCVQRNGKRVCGSEEVSPTDCSQVQCFGACPPGTCYRRKPGECCDDLGKCSAMACCGLECQSSLECPSDLCKDCLKEKGSLRGVCGQRVISNPFDLCSRVRCARGCPQGTCSPKQPGQCCDDPDRCSPGGCCGDPCSCSQGCKEGPCKKCNWNEALGKRVCGG